MQRTADPLDVPCPQCQARMGEACAEWVGDQKSSIVLAEGDSHAARSKASREKAIAAEPVDHRPWRERSLVSIVAELERKRQR